MNCKRIIIALTFHKGVLYRTKVFKPDYIYTTNFIDLCWADEVVILNISGSSPKDKKIFIDKVKLVARDCFVPLAVGGGGQNIEDVDKLFDAGADKIVINTIAIENPSFITLCSEKYGAQSVVVSIDAKKNKNDLEYRVFKNCGKIQTPWTPDKWAQEAAKYGAGEIMINSIVKDGSLSGYDMELCRMVSDSVSVPVIICGGAGNWKHFEKGFKEANANAVCTTNIYHFSEQSMKSAKEYLSSKNILVRK